MSDALGFADGDDYRRVRELLLAAGYTETGLRRQLGSSEVTATRASDLVPLLYRLDGDGPLETLIRAIFLNVAVPRQAMERALRPLPLETWVAAGLGSVEGETVESRVRLRPCRGLYMAADKPAEIRVGARHDFVMGVGKSTLLVANVALRPAMGRTLDLGTGCGFLGLAACRFSNEVFATDKNPRAAAFARFNARLNGLDNVQCLEGDTFEPVASQQFDSIISNPPFVIAPSEHYVFRDSGFRGDRFCRAIIRAAPAYLTAGGYCHLTCNFPHRAGEPWQNPIRDWFDGLGCDVLVLGGGTLTASEYVTTWIRDTEPDQPEEFPARFERWLRYLEREGIDEISFGVVILRRRDERVNWVRFEDVPEPCDERAGVEILRRFRLRDYLDSRKPTRH